MDSYEDIKEGDEVLILPRLEYYIDKREWPRIMKDLIGNIYVIKEIGFDERNITDSEGGFVIYWIKDFGERWYVYRDCIEHITRKRKLNLEEDPWGEENWGWE